MNSSQRYRRHGSCFESSGEPSPVVTTPLGRLKGRYVSTRDGRRVQAFLGIPFAKPPVGPLRFQPPQPIEPWPHERLAVVQPRACAQLPDPTSTEDCLYLNVYTPDKDIRPLLPVVVFIFGGAFEIGGIYGYTQEYILDEDVVFVTVQYRIGLFGFLSTGDTVVPGNMGLKDMRQGLRWVRDNISSFGGDPSKVTISGESAGAVGVHFLMTFTAHEGKSLAEYKVWYDATRVRFLFHGKCLLLGLFRAAISQSGTSLCSWAFHPPVEIPKLVVALAFLSGCPSDSVGFVECLMTKPTEEIVFLYTGKYKNSMYFAFEVYVSEALPLIGGVIEPECVEDRFVTGNPWDYNTTIPWLVGINSKEALFAFTPEENDDTDVGFIYINSLFDFYFPFVLNYVNSKANGTQVGFATREFYLKNLPISKPTLREFIDLGTDAMFIYPTYAAIMRSTVREKVYLTLFDHVGPNQFFPVPPDSRIGPAHGDDLFYFFEHPAAPFPDRQVYDDPDEVYFSKTMIRLWANFATCLDPTPMKTCVVQWTPFSSNHSYLHITQTGFVIKENFLEERMMFWERNEFPFRNDEIGVPPCRNETYHNLTTFIETFSFQ